MLGDVFQAMLDGALPFGQLFLGSEIVPGDFTVRPGGRVQDGQCLAGIRCLVDLADQLTRRPRIVLETDEAVDRDLAAEIPECPGTDRKLDGS